MAPPIKFQPFSRFYSGLYYPVIKRGNVVEFQPFLRFYKAASAVGD